jgi:hypothetical protein
VRTALSKIRLPLVLSLFAFAGTSTAQARAQQSSPAKVIMRTAGRARILVSKGRLRQTIDLGEEVTGCSYVSGSTRIRLTKRGCAASPATFKLIDSSTQNGDTYLVVLSEASDNCNVCGRCGATEALALIWLEFDANLRLRNKKSMTIQDCMAFIDLVISSDAANKNENPAFSFKDDDLVVEFEKRIFSENDNTNTYRFSHLRYDRRHPDLGFNFTTETREKSSQ